MATLVNNNNNNNDNTTTFSLVGTREMLTAETTTKYFATIKNPETINKIIFSTKSFDVDSAKIASTYIEKMVNLKIADLSDFIAGRETSIGLEVLNIISTALSKTKLVELDVSENALGPRGIEACKPLLASKETLARISFCNDGLSAEACESIRDLLLFRGENMPTSLTHLRFHNNMSGSGGAIAIADVVKNSPSLQLFELSSTRCGRDGGETLCSAFEFCPNIESINVGDNTFGIESGKILAQVLKNKTKLKYLKVSDIGLEDEGMSALLLSLGTEKCTNLIELDISCNDLTYEGLLSLGLVFRNNLQLEKLILDDNEIGSRGSMRVARAIEKNSKKLNHLAMMTCDIKRNGVNAICDVFLNNNKKDDNSNDNNNNDNNDKTKVLLNGNRISSESMALIQDQYIKSMESFVEFGSFSDNDSEASDDEEYEDDDITNDIKTEEEFFNINSSSKKEEANEAGNSSTNTTNNNNNNESDNAMDIDAMIKARNRAKQKRRSIIIAENALDDSDYDSDLEDVDESEVFNYTTKNDAAVVGNLESTTTTTTTTDDLNSAIENLSLC